MDHCDAVLTAQTTPNAFSRLTSDGDAIAGTHRAGGIEHQSYVDRRVVIVGKAQPPGTTMRARCRSLSKG